MHLDFSKSTTLMKKGTIFNLCCILLSLVPVIRLILLIQNTCSNVVCVDFMHSMTFINRALAGAFDYKLIFQDSTMFGHPQLVPLIFQLFFAKLFSLDALIELYSCVFFLYVSTLIAFNSMATQSTKWRFLLLPILSGIQFSLCLSSEFFYPYTFVGDTLARFCISLGIWSIVKFKNNNGSAMLMLCCGILCASCAASYAVAIWIVFVLLVLAMRRLGKSHVICILLGIPISLLPIIALSLEKGTRIDPGATSAAGFARFCATTGMAFLNNTASQVEVTSKTVLLGLVLLTALVVLSAYIIARKKLDGQVYSSWSFALFGLLNLVCTAFGRLNISPWYCTFSIHIITGIAALTFITLFEVASKNKDKFVTLGTTAFFLFCLALYISSNRTYADKDWFRAYHAPVAASSLRNYMWAPTYAHYQLFGSKLGNIERFWKYGNELSLHKLSCFSAHQTWSMQGDFILPIVQFNNKHLGESVRWILEEDLNSHPSFTEPEHFSLVLPPNSTVDWYIALPSNLKDAYLKFDHKSFNNNLDRNLNLKFISLGRNDLIKSIDLNSKKEFQSMCYSLESLKGKEIKLTFENSSSKDTLLLRYPRVETNLVGPKLLTKSPEKPTPCNLDSAIDEFGILTNVLRLDEDWKKTWTLRNCQNSESKNEFPFWGNNAQASLTYNKLLDIDTNKWNEFFFNFHENATSAPRFVLCQFILNTGKIKTGIVTLVADGKSHRYAYELKLLQLAAGEKINFIQLLPQWESSKPNRAFNISNIGFGYRAY